MNFTLGLLAGLALMLPGLSALATWNFRGAQEGASRPELPLTSVTALFLALGAAAVLHLIGLAVSSVVWPLLTMTPTPDWWLRPPVPSEPYPALWRLIDDKSGRSLSDLYAVAIILIFECLLGAALVASRGFGLLLDAADVRGQGWVHQNVLRPRRNGYDPYAYVLTSSAHGDFGLGYQGMVAEIRQGADGEVKTICLSQPQAFVYELQTPAKAESGGKIALSRYRSAKLKRHPRRWMGGVIALEASAIRNIVVHNVPAHFNEELEQMLLEMGEEVASPDFEAEPDDESGYTVTGADLIPPDDLGYWLQRRWGWLVMAALSAVLLATIALNWSPPYRLLPGVLHVLAPGFWLVCAATLAWFAWCWIFAVADLTWMALLQPTAVMPTFLLVSTVTVVLVAATMTDAAAAGVGLAVVPLITIPLANRIAWGRRDPTNDKFDLLNPLTFKWRTALFDTQHAKAQMQFEPALIENPDAPAPA